MDQHTAPDLLQALEQLHPKKIDLSLNRINRLLRALNNPEQKLPPVVHIAGTNGKGSVLAYMQAFCEAAGYRVHSYISPHLRSFNERIRLGYAHGAKNISDDYLIDVLLRTLEANKDEPITFFESTTAAAFLAFSEIPADIVLLETGLGGRLDATNVIENPILNIITPISIDHTAFLGPDIKSIAMEKAGILKPNVKAVIARQENAAQMVIEARAEELNAPLICYGTHWDNFEQQGRLVYQEEDQVLDLPLPRLAGRHQIDNAGLAIMAARQLGDFRITEHHIETGLGNTVWPGRMELLPMGALHDFFAPGSELWLDGGHNPAAAQMLAQSMAELEERLPRPLHLICAMMKNKDAEAFFSPFQGLAEFVATIPLPDDQVNGYTPSELAEAARKAKLEAAEFYTLEEACMASAEKSAAKKPVRLLICGSLYLSSDVYMLHDS